jgi:hypothetical protein
MRYAPRPRASARLLVSLGAAAGALGVMALTSTAAAPTARADDFTTIIDDTELYLSAAQADYTAADGDFSSGLSGVPEGLDALFAGANNTHIAPYEFLVASVAALQNNPIGLITPGPIVPDPPELDLATGLTDAQNNIGFAFNTYFADAASDLSAGNYEAALVALSDGSLALDFAPQDVISGSVDQLLGSI